jgi:putative permease
MSDSKSTWILWLKIFGLIGLVVVAFAYLTTVTVLFVPFICAIVLNVIFAPLASALERRDYERGTAVLILFCAFGALLAVALLFLPDLVMKEVDIVKAKWPETQLKINALLEKSETFINVRLPEENKVDLVHAVPEKLKHIGEEIIKDAPHLLAEGVIAVLLIPLFTFFLLRDGRSFKKALVAAIPNRYFEMSLNIFYKVNLQVGNYLRGLAMEASADAVVAMLLCWAFGIPNAVLIGLVAGSTTIMPLAGMVIASAICPLIALFSAPSSDPTQLLMLMGLVVAAIFLTHLIDNIIIAPIIMGHSVHMHPVMVIVSILLGGKLFGVLGIMLAVPVISILTAVFQEGYQGIKSNEYFLKSS